ncbi:FAD-binding oxidoreductase [Candidatus Wolfebacteria bacterium]|nr:MAG: FAD-binding oxidoreductase [Candidatus Wolfebacteria bacterium]
MKEQLQKIIEGDVLDDEKTLTEFSQDTSLFDVRPQVVVFPKHAEDVKAVVNWVNENKDTQPADTPALSITARSAGTDMSGGPLNESIILNFTKYMHGAPEIDVENKTARVLPGTMYIDFENETLKHELLLPTFPASKTINAVGGMAANNTGGEKTLRYGKTEEYIEKLKVVFSDGNEYEIKALSKNELEEKINQNDFEGNIYKEIWELIQNNEEKIKNAKPNVSKNSAGYYLWNVWNGTTFDLNRLIVGSQGTLGIITEITFRLVPVEKFSKLLVVFMDGMDGIPAVVNKALKYNPTSMETYDDETLKLAIRFWRGFIKERGFLGFLKMGLSFIPDFFMFITGGIPKLITLIEFTGDNEAELEKKLSDLDKELTSLHITTGGDKKFKIRTQEVKTKAGEEKYWSIRRDSFKLLREHSKGKRTAPFIDDFIVSPEVLPEFFPELQNILAQYPIDYSIAGHAGSGNFHIIPLMDLAEPIPPDTILELSEKVYSLVLSYNGSITAEHNDGIIRTPFLRKMYGDEIIALFQKVKDTFDPNNIFNPGKKVGGSKQYIKDHLIQSKNQTE